MKRSLMIKGLALAALTACVVALDAQAGAGGGRYGQGGGGGGYGQGGGGGGQGKMTQQRNQTRAQAGSGGGQQDGEMLRTETRSFSEDLAQRRAIRQGTE